MQIRNKIESILTSSEKGRYPFTESFLLLLSYIYSSGTSLRKTLYRQDFLKIRQLPCIVISIGNLTLGGTGKTPMAVKTARLIKDLGYKVAIISRGYGGTESKNGGMVSDGESVFMDWQQAGDEPFMMAKSLSGVPVAIGRDRFKIGLQVMKVCRPDIIILDDAYQHLKLKRDIDLVLMDYHQPFGNTHLFPRGSLREAISGLERSDALILTRSDATTNSPVFNRNTPIAGKPIFRAHHEPYIYKIENNKTPLDVDEKPDVRIKDFSSLKGRRVCVCSGIAKNEEFRKTVEKFQCNIVCFLEFPDHHPYSTEDFLVISERAKTAGADFILTTEKDFVRIAHHHPFSIPLVAIGIEISFDGEDHAFKDFLLHRILHTKKNNGTHASIQNT